MIPWLVAMKQSRGERELTSAISAVMKDLLSYRNSRTWLPQVSLPTGFLPVIKMQYHKKKRELYVQKVQISFDLKLHHAHVFKKLKEAPPEITER